MTRPSLASIAAVAKRATTAAIAIAAAYIIPLLFILALTALGLVLRSMGGAHVPFGAIR